jgi:hypothetical protein
MSIVARNALWFARSSNFISDPLASTTEGGIVQAVAAGAMRFACSSNLALFSSASNVWIGAFGVPDIVVVGSNGIIVKGDVRLTGGLETISTTEMAIQGKVLHIAQPSGTSSNPVYDADIDGAGVVVGSNNYSAEKSIRWMQGYTISQTPMPSRWSLQGGGLHISRVFDGGARTVSFGLQINDEENLEFVRHEWNSSGGSGGGGLQQRVFVMSGSASASSNFPFLPLHLAE